MYGANPEQLTALGNTLRSQKEPINQLISTVTGVLGGTTWEGPARQRFEQDWNGTFRTSLTRLMEAFEAAGNDCITRSERLAAVMGG